MTNISNCTAALLYELDFKSTVDIPWEYFLRSQDVWSLVHCVFTFWTFLIFVPVITTLFGPIRKVVHELATMQSPSSTTESRKISSKRQTLAVILVWSIDYIGLSFIVLAFFAKFGIWEAFVEPSIASISEQIVHDYPSIRNNTDIFSKIIYLTWFGEKWIEQVADCICNYITGIFVPLLVFWATRTNIWITLTKRELLWRVLLYLLVFLLQPLPMIYVRLNTCLPLWDPEVNSTSLSNTNYLNVGVWFHLLVMAIATLLVYCWICNPHWFRVYLSFVAYTALLCAVCFVRPLGILPMLAAGVTLAILFFFAIGFWIGPKWMDAFDQERKEETLKLIDLYGEPISTQKTK